MDKNDMLGQLDILISQWENEVVEFKEGGKGFSTHDIGKYFSALSNEANLKGVSKAWLVFGVENKTRRIIGSDYDASETAQNRPGGIKYQITQSTDPAMCFNRIEAVEHEQGRVIVFEIPAAPQGIPVAWKGHYYARTGENLVALGLDKLDAIRREGLEDDWSTVAVEGATYNDLDELAISKARKGFAKKNVLRYTEDEVNGWDLRTFLDRARLTRNGVITRATMLLIGKELSSHLLSPYPAQLVWKLVGEENANDIFYPPFLLSTTALYSRIRNVQIRIQPQGWLVPTEVPKYVDTSVLEALHNCIAHQNYRLNGRVVVTEHVDRLVFENRGSFYEGRPEDYVGGNKTPSRYRNLQLVKAMREINMIDTQGYGIHRLYEEQRRRYFPLPDYELGKDYVKTTIYGHVVDPAYSSLLIKRDDLALDDVCLLDRIQKGLRIDARAVAHLRREGLIEGRVPHLHISMKVAEMTGTADNYVKVKSVDESFCMHKVLEFICLNGGATREDIDGFLSRQLSPLLTAAQKKTKIGNLLSGKMNLRLHWIKNVGSRSKPRWILTDIGCEECKKANSNCKKACKKAAG